MSKSDRFIHKFLSFEVTAIYEGERSLQQVPQKDGSFFITVEKTLVKFYEWMVKQPLKFLGLQYGAYLIYGPRFEKYVLSQFDKNPKVTEQIECPKCSYLFPHQKITVSNPNKILKH